VTDAGDGTASHPNKIDRYDPTNGQYLGSFASGYFGTPNGMKVSGFDVYVADQHSGFSKIDKFNWSTGMFEASYFNSSPYNFTGVETYGNSVIALDSGTGAGGAVAIWTFDATTGATLGSFSLPASSGPQRASVKNGYLYVGSSAWSPTRYTLNANGTVVAGSAFGLGLGNETALTTNTWGGVDYFNDSANTGSPLALNRRLLSTGAVISGVSIATSFTGLSFGHNGVLYGQTGNRVDRYDTNALFLGTVGSFNLTQTWNAKDIQVYAAPEPFSMAALGAGVLTLLRRKRRG